MTGLQELSPIFSAVCAVLGLLVGSFLNVVIYRLPRSESVVFPASHCPECGHAVRWYHNVPVLGWLWLRGRCHDCNALISAEYPLVEATTGLLFGGIAWHFGPVVEVAVYLPLVAALLAATVIDLHHQILPDRITLPGIVLGLLASATLLPTPFLSALIGAALGYGLFYAITIISRGGMGGGDRKYIAMIGAFLGWPAVLLTTFLATTLGAVVGLALMGFYGKGRKFAVPFGPFLSLGAVVCLLWGDQLIAWYLGLSHL